MIDRRRFTALALTAAAFPALPHAARAGDDAAQSALVEALYAAHAPRADGGLPPLWKDPSTRDVYFSEGLLALFDAAAEAAEAAPDEVPALNGDPFYDAQDWNISGFAVAPAATDGDAATVAVGFDNFGDPRRLLYTLVKSGQGWRVDDIAYGGEPLAYTLRGLLAGE
ncbi:MAG TPA: DUF3828 domain-containing protein [Methylomirabilota bacterium]|nr:DUF3828 domain-containing protein [Methylomirabilota bacterium]